MTGLEGCYNHATVSRAKKKKKKIYLNIISGHVAAFMSKVFPDGRTLFQLQKGPATLQKLIEDLLDRQ